MPIITDIWSDFSVIFAINHSTLTILRSQGFPGCNLTKKRGCIPFRYKGCQVEHTVTSINEKGCGTALRLCEYDLQRCSWVKKKIVTYMNNYTTITGCLHKNRTVNKSDLSDI